MVWSDIPPHAWLLRHAFVQDEESRALLAGIGVDNVVVAGDTRFDRVTDILEDHTDLPVVESFSAVRSRCLSEVRGSLMRISLSHTSTSIRK